jgi:hypothetical protein
MKIVCSLMFLLAFQAHAREAQDSLVMPDTILTVHSARSRLIHLLQTGKFDSTAHMISQFENRVGTAGTWLTGHERVLISVLRGDMDTLQDPQFYIKHLCLRDTAAPGDMPGTVPRYEQFSAGPGSPDNLAPFLLRNYEQKRIIYKNRFPQYEFLWEFLDLVFDYDQNKVIRYLVNYANSPFARLVKFNYLVRYRYTADGLMIGGGYGYVNLDSETNRLFDDRLSFSISCDYYLAGFGLLSALTLSKNGTRSITIVDRDTIQVGTFLRNFFIEIAVGRIISIHDRLYLTPFAGGGVFYSLPHIDSDLSLPPAWGIKTGLSAHLRLALNDPRFLDSPPAPDPGIRFDAGVRYNKFYRIRSDLGTWSYFINVGLEVIKFRFKRSYEVN